MWEWVREESNLNQGNSRAFSFTGVDGLVVSFKETWMNPEGFSKPVHT